MKGSSRQKYLVVVVELKIRATDCTNRDNVHA
jgi:hypothetical protein